MFTIFSLIFIYSRSIFITGHVCERIRIVNFGRILKLLVPLIPMVKNLTDRQ